MSLSDDERRAIVKLIENVADVSHQNVHGWRQHGNPPDVLQSTILDFDGEMFTVLRDRQCNILVFDEKEITGFLNGIESGKFDFAGVLRERKEGEESNK